MTAPLATSPLQRGRTYRDRRGRRWTIQRITNAGREGYGGALPAMAFAVCIEADAAANVDTRSPQWFVADSGRWSLAVDSELDLVRAA